jgi:hypothetical protein
MTPQPRPQGAPDARSGDLDEKDRVLGTLVTLVQRREHHELAAALLWLGLWPGLDAVDRLGLSHEATRKRFQLALGRLREHLSISLSHPGRAGRVCSPRND